MIKHIYFMLFLQSIFLFEPTDDKICILPDMIHVTL